MAVDCAGRAQFLSLGYEEVIEMGLFDSNGNDRTKGGPKVKTGPNAGLTRAKNDDGRWREKRDDAGKKRT